MTLAVVVIVPVVVVSFSWSGASGAAVVDRLVGVAVGVDGGAGITWDDLASSSSLSLSSCWALLVSPLAAASVVVVVVVVVVVAAAAAFSSSSAPESSLSCSCQLCNDNCRREGVWVTDSSLLKDVKEELICTTLCDDDDCARIGSPVLLVVVLVLLLLAPALLTRPAWDPPEADERREGSPPAASPDV